VVWVVIDALRFDFVAALEEVGGVGYSCDAPSPTITLPRLFALVTGSEPSFSAALSNFGGRAALSEDNLLRLWKQQHKRLVFYGDDTWLRLFPHTFERSEGVSSFSVQDTVEVDHNVSRHLTAELRQSDWDVLILHYLGLDHVGHSLGPAHPRKTEKLAEMQNILLRIQAQLTEKDLLVVSGDHGMTAEGNHGGASMLETHTGVLFTAGTKNTMAKSKLKMETSACHQSDVSATLAALTGTPAPSNCLGLPLQMPLQMFGGDFEKELNRTRRRLQRWSGRVGHSVTDAGRSNVRELAIQLRNLGSARVGNLVYGLVGLGGVMWNLMFGGSGIGSSYVQVGIRMSLGVAGGALLQPSWYLWSVILYLMWFSHFTGWKGMRRGNWTIIDAGLALAIVLWPFSSSFAEEAYLPLYFLLQSRNLWQLLQQPSLWRPRVLGIVLLRLAKELQACGDKWRIVTVWQQLDYPWYTSLVLLWLTIGWPARRSKKVTFLAIVFSLYHWAPQPPLALLASLLSGGLFIWDQSIFAEIGVLTLQMVHRANGMGAVAIVSCTYWLFRLESPTTISYIQVQYLVQCTAALMGYSLSIASIPLAGAYTYVNEYNSAIVFLTGFVMISFSYVLSCSAPASHPSQELLWVVLQCFTSCLSAFFQRNHLFVWSVFGPLVVFAWLRLVQTLLFRICIRW
jgi:hypothetical protein